MAKNILKSKYGQMSNIVSTYVQNLIAFPSNTGNEKLEMRGKLKQISGYLRMSIDKIQGIRGDLVRTDNN